MIQTHFLKTVRLLFLFLFPLLAHAAIPAWQIIPNASSLTFTATQNDAPVSGKFKQFSGNILFDTNALNQSSVTITVETGSVSASYKDLVDTLKTPDWFNVKLFPQAIFKANQFKKTGDKTYEAKGDLTIRNKTLPITITFNVVEMTDTKAKVMGSTLIKRNAFGVGQGEWSSTDEVKDDVKINFTLSVVKITNHRGYIAAGLCLITLQCMKSIRRIAIIWTGARIRTLR